jgi:periplasmic divalent cation tolerance protein
MDIIICFVTAPSLEVATTLATQLVDCKLAACTNIIPGVRSVYRWNDSITVDEEVLMVIKTVVAKRQQLRDFIVAEHPYDVPEFVSLSTTDVSPQYAAWVANSITD